MPVLSASSSYRSYAGIGSRTTPASFAPLFANYAKRLATLGYTLRSGRATGADSFFEAGAGAAAELFRPSGREGVTSSGARIIVPSGEILDRCTLLASVAHPNWGACSEYARLLHARNACQVHGERLDSTVDFVVAYAQPSGPDAVSGGTGLAWGMARMANVPRFNLAVPSEIVRFEAYLASIT